MRSPCPRSWMRQSLRPGSHALGEQTHCPNVSTAGSAPTPSRSQYSKWPLVMLGLSTCNVAGWRPGSYTMSGLFRTARRLSRLTNASKEGPEKWTDLARYDFPWSSSPYARPHYALGTTT